MNSAEQIAMAFHATYERLASDFNYEPPIPWDQLPERNRFLMVAVVGDLLLSEVIQEGDAL